MIKLDAETDTAFRDALKQAGIWTEDKSFSYGSETGWEGETRYFDGELQELFKLWASMKKLATAFPAQTFGNIRVECLSGLSHDAKITVGGVPVEFISELQIRMKAGEIVEARAILCGLSVSTAVAAAKVEGVHDLNEMTAKLAAFGLKLVPTGGENV